MTTVPTGWVELDTRAIWDTVRTMGGFIVITDDINPQPIYHHRGCRAVKLANFTDKVLDRVATGMRPNGQYFWVASKRVAEAGGARACLYDDDPLYDYT